MFRTPSGGVAEVDDDAALADEKSRLDWTVVQPAWFVDVLLVMSAPRPSRDEMVV